MTSFLILHGPNLNLTGEREPEIYGTMTLAEVDARLSRHAKDIDVEITCRQSNHEGELIDMLHDARTWASGVVFNPGAYTHYSYALRDAVSAIGLPVVEVHLSRPAVREPFRQRSVIAPVCLGQIAGFGWYGYAMAMDALNHHFGRPNNGPLP
jgi:3-dehydroquinate dehydratase II